MYCIVSNKVIKKTLRSFLVSVFLLCGLSAFLNAQLFISMEADTRSTLDDLFLDEDEVQEIVADEFFQTQDSLGEVLQSETSVNVKSSGKGALETVSIRGLQSKNIQVILNGIPLQRDSTGTTNISNIPISQIEKIEILKNPAPSLGYNASAVVFITTKTYLPDEKHARVYADYSNLNTSKVSAGVGGQIKKVNWNFDASNQRSNGFMDHSDYRKKSASGSLNYDLSGDGYIRLYSIYSGNRLNLSGGTDVPIDQWDGKKEKAAQSYVDWQEDEFVQTSLSGKIDNDIVPLIFLVSRSDLKTDSFSFGSDTDIKNYENRYKLSGDVLENFNIGLEHTYSKFKTNASWVNNESNTIKVNSGFVNYIFEKSKFKVNLSARLDDSSEHDRTTSYGTIINYYANDEYRLFTSLGRSFNTPTFADLNSATEQLSTERNDYVDLGLAYKKDFLDLKASIFFSKTKDKIGLREVSPWVWGSFNMAKDRRKGIDFEGKYKYKYVDFIASYTYLSAQTKENSSSEYAQTYFTPKHNFNFVVAYEKNSYDFKLTSSYTAKQYTNIGEAGTKLPGFALFNFYASQKFGNLKFFASIENLLDERYATNGSYYSWQTPSEIYYPAPTRTFMLGVSYDFNL